MVHVSLYGAALAKQCL